MPVPQDIRDQARELDALHWIETLDDWESRLGEPPHANNWHLTDLRHLGNLESARAQGLLTEDTPPARRTRIEQLEDAVRDWIEDHLEPDDPEPDDPEPDDPEPAAAAA